MEADPQNSPPTISLSSSTPQTSPPTPPSDNHEPALKKTKMSSTSTTSDDSITTERPRRYKRRKVAIFMAYCGVGYQGMQKNPGAKTIEGDLEEALFLAGAVPEDERGQHKRYDWARSARTDKGVSAVGQVISGRFFLDPPGFVQRLNSFLSPQIRIFGYKRATPSFSAKKFCDRRRYVYLLPVFALDPSCHRDRESVMASLGSGEELVKCVECSERGRKVVGLMGNKRDFRNEGLIQSGISSHDCDASMIQVKDGESNGCLENGKGAGEEVKTDVGAEVLDQSGILSNSCDALMLDADGKMNDEGGVGTEVLAQSGISSYSCVASLVQVNEEENNACSENDNVAGEELKTSLSAEVLAQSGISSNSGGALMSSVEEKVNEQEEGDRCVEIVNSVGEELKDDVGNVKAEVLVQFGIPLDNEEAESLLNAEVDGNKESADNNGGAEMGESSGIVAEGSKGEFKYGEEVKKRFNRILKYYEGTHNFHNFTTRTKAEDPSAKRYIVSFQANTTLTIEGIEFVKCEVLGQSFMLHQIRKMMGMAVAVMRNFTSESIYETAFNQGVKINVPTAPEVGLYLDECFFTSYNNKWNGTHEEVSMKSYAEEAEEFKLKNIYTHIANMEHKEGAVALWLHSLNRRNYPDLCHPSQQGLVEEGAAQ